MATGVSAQGTGGLLVGVESARSVLKERVSQLRASVQQIENELSAEIDRVEKEQKQKHSEYRDNLYSLTAIRAGIEKQFDTGEFEDLKNSIISDTDRKIHAVESKYKRYRVDIAWEEGLCEQLKGIGKVELTENRIEDTCGKKIEVKVENIEVKEPTLPVAEKEMSNEIPAFVFPVESKVYSSRCRPVATIEIPELTCQYPQGIAYDDIDNAVYVLDNTSCKLYSYSIDSKTVREGVFISFANPLNQGVHSYNNIILQTKKEYPPLPEMDIFIFPPRPSNRNLGTILQPCGIEFNNNKLYLSAVSRINHTFDIIARLSFTNDLCSKHIELSGYFGKHGSEEGEMNTPRGIAFSDSHLYVCDSNNNRINVYFNEYIVRTFSHSSLYRPLDVKTDRGGVFVLNSRLPFVIEFHHTGILSNTFLSTDIISGFSPSFFCIDMSGRFLISDNTLPYVYVFNRDRNMKRALETRLQLQHGEEREVEPRGVCVDREGRVYVVCNYKQAMLQIF